MIQACLDSVCKLKCSVENLCVFRLYTLERTLFCLYTLERRQIWCITAFQTSPGHSSEFHRPISDFQAKIFGTCSNWPKNAKSLQNQGRGHSSRTAGPIDLKHGPKEPAKNGLRAPHDRQRPARLMRPTGAFLF